MKQNWSGKTNILCIRPDNMGDVLMSSPAIRAMKKSFDCRITLLTSSLGAKIVAHLGCVDEVIVCDMPWVKLPAKEGAAGFYHLVEQLREKKFDGAVIFSVFSQNPMPSILLAYLAGIPSRASYCRENPYELLTHWLPDKEPLAIINHQVVRDTALVKSLGAFVENDELRVNVPANAYSELYEKLNDAGIDIQAPWMLVHAGVSEKKREYPPDRFHPLIKKIIDELDVQVILSGTASEKKLVNELLQGISERAHSVAGMLSLSEFMALIDIAPVVLSVNTATVHIAAALKTPVIVLYAQTNPQHTPWKSPSQVFTFPVKDELKSKNEILRYVDEHVTNATPYPEHSGIVLAIRTLAGNVLQSPA